MEAALTVSLEAAERVRGVLYGVTRGEVLGVAPVVEAKGLEPMGVEAAGVDAMGVEATGGEATGVEATGVEAAVGAAVWLPGGVLGGSEASSSAGISCSRADESFAKPLKDTFNASNDSLDSVFGFGRFEFAATPVAAVPDALAPPAD